MHRVSLVVNVQWLVRVLCKVGGLDFAFNLFTFDRSRRWHQQTKPARFLQRKHDQLEMLAQEESFSWQLSFIQKRSIQTHRIMFFLAIDLLHSSERDSSNEPWKTESTRHSFTRDGPRQESYIKLIKYEIGICIYCDDHVKFKPERNRLTEKMHIPIRSVLSPQIGVVRMFASFYR